MNREKILFFVVLGIAVLWGGSELLAPYTFDKPKAGPDQFVSIPAMKVYGELENDEQRLLKLVSGWPDLSTAIPAKGRTTFVEYSPLLPVDPAVLQPPRAMGTPVVLPPIVPFPPVPWFRNFRTWGFGVVDGVPPEGAPDDPGMEEEGDEPSEGLEEALGRRKKEYDPREWDHLKLLVGEKVGKISLTKDGREKGLTKFHLLLNDHRNLPFYFEQIDTGSLKPVGSGTSSLETMKAVEVQFADNIANRYWSRRVTDRIEKGDWVKLLNLGRWIMELADDTSYVKKDGLDLAVKTLREALEVDQGNAEIILALGEALHRTYDYDAELILYEDAIAARDAPALRKRTARIFRNLGIPDLEEQALDLCLKLLPGDVEARLYRGEARYLQNSLDDAHKDFRWVSTAEGRTAEMEIQAIDGMARVSIARGDPAKAQELLIGRTDSGADASALTTLGAALYAQMKFAEAKDMFQQALDLDENHFRAKTWLGFALAHTAETWEEVDSALKLLSEARDAHPLNYFSPHVGSGFAHQRRGPLAESEGTGEGAAAAAEARRTELTLSVDEYQAARMALPLDPYIHYILGISYARDGRPAEARTSFLKALEIDYRFVDALIWAGTVSLDMEDWPEARAFLARALELENREYEAATSPGPKAAALKTVTMLRYRLARAVLQSPELTPEDRDRMGMEQLQEIIKIDKTHVLALTARGILEYRAGEVGKAKESLRDAISYSVEGSPERDDAEKTLEEIERAENRRRWQELFDRKDSSTVGNGWKAVPLAGLGPRLESGKVLIEGGRQQQRGEIMLLKDEKAWGNQFLGATAKVRVEDNHDAQFQFIVFTTDGGKSRRGGGTNAPQLFLLVGVERDPRGYVATLEKKARNAPVVSKIVQDSAGNDMKWPEGENVVLKIRRSEKKDNEYDVFMDGVKIRTLEGPTKTREALAVGFRWICGRQKAFTSSVDEVEVEIDLNG